MKTTDQINEPHGKFTNRKARSGVFKGVSWKSLRTPPEDEIYRRYEFEMHQRHIKGKSHWTFEFWRDRGRHIKNKYEIEITGSKAAIESEIKKRFKPNTRFCSLFGVADKVNSKVEIYTLDGCGYILGQEEFRLVYDGNLYAELI
jgi:hypothetical protein